MMDDPRSQRCGDCRFFGKQIFCRACNGLTWECDDKGGVHRKPNMRACSSFKKKQTPDTGVINI